jgi:sugar lactone lactonase YvrE
VLDADLTISNGLAWSPAGDVMYSVDTVPGVVWSRPYDPATGECGERTQLVRLGHGGWPDGLCVDTDGNLWVASGGGAEVRCYTPAGERLATVSVPAPHTTSVAFVGPDRDTLLITTATDQLTVAQLEEFPLSGRLFTAHVGAVGEPITPWSGR